MEREQISKALECLASEKDVLCEGCAYQKFEGCAYQKFEGCAYQKFEGLTCHKALAKDTLALIKELTEENERLTKQIEMSEAAYQELQFAFSICAKQVKADTIREFAERLTRYYAALNDKSASLMICYHIDQIAKEMLKSED